ncbi:MAG: hypothetical protein J3K34DRAFT_164856 [Monoraphidium minutum]|nr:MAG: hypothetical protein J3K34DRAFT_164856 [Monoraphidium minutum]
MRCLRPRSYYTYTAALPHETVKTRALHARTSAPRGVPPRPLCQRGPAARGALLRGAGRTRSPTQRNPNAAAPGAPSTGSPERAARDQSTLHLHAAAVRTRAPPPYSFESGSLALGAPWRMAPRAAEPRRPRPFAARAPGKHQQASGVKRTPPSSSRPFLCSATLERSSLRPGRPSAVAASAGTAAATARAPPRPLALAASLCGLLLASTSLLTSADLGSPVAAALAPVRGVHPPLLHWQTPAWQPASPSGQP